jgi:hypothetical protein
MSSPTETHPTPGRRLTRGLCCTALGAVETVRGVAELALNGAQASARRLGDRQRGAELKERLSDDLAAVQAALADLPSGRRSAAKAARRRRRLFIAAGATVVVAGAAAVTVAIIRRSTRPDPSTLPPSVEVNPKP